MKNLTFVYIILNWGIVLSTTTLLACSNSHVQKTEKIEILKDSSICSYTIYGINPFISAYLPIGRNVILDSGHFAIHETQITKIDNKSDIDEITHLMKELESGEEWDNVGDFRVVLLREYCDGRADTFGIPNGGTHIYGLGKSFEILNPKLMEKILIPISVDYYQLFTEPEKYLKFPEPIKEDKAK